MARKSIGRRGRPNNGGGTRRRGDLAKKSRYAPKFSRAAKKLLEGMP